MALNKKLPQLVSIRGLAAWWVVVFHFLHLIPANTPGIATALIAKGYLAVDLFFVLSGFIISINYADRVSTCDAGEVMAFYWNRISRVYPVHFCMLGAYLLLYCAYFFFASRGAPPSAYSIAAFVESLALIQAFTGHALTWNVPSWSISAECGAYLLFPLFAFLFRRYVGGMLRHLAAGAALMLLIVLAFKSANLSSLGGAVEKMAPLRTVLEFLLGMVIGSAYVNDRPSLEKLKPFFLATAVAGIAIYSYGEVRDYVIFPAAFAFLIAYLSTANGLTLKLASNKVLLFLGEISYSTYMVHYFVHDVFKAIWLKPGKPIEASQLLLCLAVTLLLSVVMYRWIEVPAQRVLRIKFALSRLPAKTM